MEEENIELLYQKKTKKKILKAARQHNRTTNFSSETMEARRQWDDIF